MASELKLIREDFINALGEWDTFMDITPEDLMALNAAAVRHARARMTESIPIERVMSKEVVTVTADTSLSDAAHLLVKHRISGLPVVDESAKLIGLITEADFLRALGLPSHHPSQTVWQTLEAMLFHRQSIREPEGTVHDLMVDNVVTIRKEDAVHEAVNTMKKYNIKRVIVCDDDNHVCGMVTRSNLVRLFFDRFNEQETSG
ncbi:MAG: CBS domain-containing protein [Gammaproteobacteria bacterium]|jgi:CBS domain-containing protein